MFERNVRVMMAQGATIRDVVLELSRKLDGDYLGEPDPKIEQRVAKVVRALQVVLV